jgi:hydrogenase maturation protease
MTGGYWEELERPAPDAVTTDGQELRAGSRVRLHPKPGGDIWDIALEGRAALIERIEQDLEGRTMLAVILDDDPGRDFGFARHPGHRFFFGPEEVEPLAPAHITPSGARILVAGIGNVFLGDDGFGVALADRLARRALPTGVEVRDFGIRGMDLAFAMHDGYDAVVLLDATPRGQRPGTLYVIEVDPAEASPAIHTHGMDPVKVLGLARSLCSHGVPDLPRTFVVGCEPATRMTGDEEEIVARLSEPVRGALDEAVRLVESLITEISNSEEVPTS